MFIIEIVGSAFLSDSHSRIEYISSHPSTCVSTSFLCSVMCYVMKWEMIVFPTLSCSVGRPKHVRVMAGALEGDIFIGPKAEVIPCPTEEALSQQGTFTVPHAGSIRQRDMSKRNNFLLNSPLSLSHSKENKPNWFISPRNSLWFWRGNIWNPHFGKQRPVQKKGLLPSFYHYVANDQIDWLGYFLAKVIEGRSWLGYPGDKLISTVWQSPRAASRSRTTESLLPTLVADARRLCPGTRQWGGCHPGAHGKAEALCFASCLGIEHSSQHTV